MKTPTSVAGSRRTPERRGPKPRLSREQVLAAALAVADRDGLDGMTVAAVADELGVGTMTVYGYIGSKDELYEGVTELVFSTFPTELDTAQKWDEQLAAVLDALCELIDEHPATVGVMLVSRTSAPEKLDPLRELLLRILREAGLPDQDAVHAITALVGHIVGWHLMTATRYSPDDPDAERTRMSTLARDEFPNLADAAPHWSSQTAPASLRYGLDHLLAGIRRDVTTDGDR